MFIVFMGNGGSLKTSSTHQRSTVTPIKHLHALDSVISGAKMIRTIKQLTWVRFSCFALLRCREPVKLSP